MKKKFTPVFFSTLLCLFSTLVASGQNSYRKVWDKTFGGHGSDVLLFTVPIHNGGYLLGGTSNSDNSGNKSNNSKGMQDFWVIKTDNAGNKIWDKTYGGSGYDFLQAAQPTSDGGFILAGTSNSPGGGDRTVIASSQYDYWILKINAAGEKVWDKSFGGSSNDHLKSICTTRDGGYILAGSSDSPASGRTPYNKTTGNRGEQDYWIVKVDASGNKQWDKTYGGSNYDYLQSVQPTRDNGYILAGYSYSPKGGDKTAGSNLYGDFWVLKMDASGNKQWDKTYGGNQEEILKTCLVTPDGGYLLAGSSNSSVSGDKTDNSNGLTDFWLVKTDANGKKQWDKTYGGFNNDYLQAISETSDKGFLLGGTSSSPVTGDKTSKPRGEADFWILKINASGSKQWDKTLGGENHDNLQALQAVDANRFVLGGTTTSGAGGDKTAASRGETDYWLISLATGDSGDSDNPPAPEEEIKSFTLLNADTDSDIQSLLNNSVLDLAALPTANLNIRANTSSNAISVAFRLSGSQTLERTETNAPYIVFGSSGTDYYKWVPTPGDYTLEAIPSSNGQAGTPLVIHFKLVKQQTGNKVPVAAAGPDASINLPVNTLKLNGSGSDVDGSIAKYQWAQVSGPNTATFNYKNVAQPTLSKLVAGTYVFSLIVTDNENAASVADQVTVTVNSSNSTTQQVTSYSLMNADTDTEILTIQNGAIINLANLPTQNLNIRANTNPGKVGSLVYALSGAYTINKSETAAPYALFGDEAGNYKAVALKMGTYNLTATPYSLAGGSGVAGTPLTINFKVTRTAGSAVSPDSSYIPEEEEELVFGDEPWEDSSPFPSTSDEITELINFPNPFQGETSFQFSFPEEQEYTLEIYDLNGTLIHHVNAGTAPAGETITETWNTGNLANGIYLVKLITNNEVQHLQIIRGD